MAEEIVFIVNDTQETVSLFVDSGSAAGVDSFNTRIGVVVPASGDYNTDQVTEVTNLYYTEARVSANSSVAANTSKTTNQLPSSSTGTILSLTNNEGILYNMSSANAATTYTTTGTTLNAYARVLINAASEPVITGATKITGNTFVVSTNMYMTAWYNGVAVQFWFETI